MKTLTLTAVVLFCTVLSTVAQVGHWRLDNNGSDASSNNIDGTSQNSPTFSTDKKEGTHALVLNGTNQYVDLGNPIQFPSGTSAKTISAWAKTNVTTGNGVIFSYGSPSTSQAFYLGMNGTSLVGGAFGNSLTESNFWTTDTWQHVCMTYDGATVRLYAGGVEVNFATRSWGVVLQRAYIGRHVNNNNYWNGSIDDVRIYDRALSPSEVAALAETTTPQVPSAPTNLTATTVSETQINLTWTDNSTDETGFVIERSSTSSTAGFVVLNTTAPNVVSFSNQGLTGGMEYYYRVSAVNANGSSTYAEADATTTSLQPPAPTNLTVTANSSTAINVTWDDNSTNETGFQIYRSTTLNGTYSLIHTTTANVTSYLNTSLTPSTAYFYQVRAVNGSGTSDYTAKENATTLSEGINTVPDEIEFQVLYDIFHSLGGQNWTTKTNWPVYGNWPSSATYQDFSQWYGIRVVNGDITSIVLNANNLSGTLPSSIGLLSKVIQIHLQENQIVGEIPSTIGELSSLQFLYLFSNQLTGSIPTTIGDLSELRYLYLKSNQLSGSLPAEINQLTKLYFLAVNSNNLTGEIPYLGELEKLTYLSLGHNLFTEGPVPDWIRRFPDLTTLSLVYTNRVGPIPDFFGELPKLSFLNLEFNQLTGPIPSSLGLSSELQNLRLNNNQLTGQIPITFFGLTKLIYLNLSSNNLSGGIPTQFNALTNLITLYLHANKLSGTIPAELGELTSLKNLNLGTNELTGEIPSAFGNLVNLEVLYLHTNQLTGRIPDSFSNLTKMLNFQLYDNNLSGVFADCFANWTDLTLLRMENNKFNGDFPPSIVNCTKLTYLNALNNEFSSIPEGLVDLHLLYYLVFTQNQLKTIPSFDQHLNKANLIFSVYGNHLDFSTLEPNSNAGIKKFTYGSQTISDVKEVLLTVGQPLVIPARPPGEFSTITWEKQNANGGWVNVNNLNEDPTQKTFKKNSATVSEKGVYRWRMTNTKVTGLTLLCEPIEVNSIQELVLERWAFQYRYDSRKRMTQKKVPGADWVYMVYDHRDRLVLTQDGNQRAKKDENNTATPQWTFTKYDALNRPIFTGIYTHSEVVDQETMQIFVNGQYGVQNEDGQYPAEKFYEDFNEVASTMGYTNRTFPNTNTDVLTVTYYDRYNFRSMISGTDDEYTPNELDAQEEIENQRVLGQVTGTQVNVLGAPTPTFLWSVNYYDDKYRVIQNIAKNQLGGRDIVTNVYDFVGKVMNTRTTHNAGSTGQQIVERKFNYDHAGRLMKTWHKLNAQDWVLLTMNEYNELGQLVTKKLHNTDAEQASDESRQFKQNVDYRYNIRGWLESVNDLAESEGDLFGMNLHYNNPTANGGTPQYNGNISEIQWKGPDAKTNSYGYNYDPMNRLTEANFYNATNGNRFNEHIKSPDNKSGYDLNGNILFLQRNGKTGIDGVGITTYGEMDKLKYVYRGNQLLKVTDDAIDTVGFIDGSNTDNDYDYDKNGNMIIDKNKSIDGATTAMGKSVISYNYLNLPEKVVKSNGEYLKYIYDATGRKLSQEVYNASNELQKKSDYAGEFFYEDNTLKFVNHEEGRVVMSGLQGEYQYHLKDHLGNVRLTFTTKEELESVTATLEDASASTEQSQFLNYAEVRKIDNKVFDHTDEGGTYNSTRLIGGNTTEIYGLAKTLSVMPGDVIRMEVYAKYLDPDTDNWSGALQNIISSIAGSGNAGGTYVDGGQLGTTDGAFPHPGLLVRENDEGEGPKAYLNYLVFDRDFNYLTGGFERVSTAARESGTTLNTNAEGVNHERLHFDDGIVINEAGYVYIYLSNENETTVEVFFDDFMVEHVKSPVVQLDDYYPFGLSFNSNSKENSVRNMYQYNGKEKQDELDLGWLDYGARMYQPEIARWNAIDPLSDAYYSNSAYSYVLGNPIANKDEHGMWTVSRHHKMTLQALSDVGIGGEQAELVAHYTSVYADNPAGHLRVNNLIQNNAGDRVYYRSDIDYSSTKNSQVTKWYPGDGMNYNVWHSMRSFYEMHSRERGGRAFGISAKDAMARGLSFGWNKVFESAATGSKLSEMQKNSEGIQSFGQGLHALQDAYAHQGRHDVGTSHIYNDIYGDTKQAEAISKSAVVVHKLLTNDFSGIKTNQINIVTEGMSAGQIKTVMKQIGQYFNYLNERKKKNEEKK